MRIRDRIVSSAAAPCRNNEVGPFRTRGIGVKTTLKTTVTVATLLLAASTMSGCSYIEDYMNQNKAQRDEETNEITEEGELDVFAVKVGDCVIDPTLVSDADEASEISELAAVPCADEHDLEIIHEFALPDGDFPTDEAVDEAAGAECIPAFDEFIGFTYEDSALGLSYLSPTQGSWEELDDRLVQCYVFDPAGKVEGTLEGAAR
jgi:hypothetical protein